MTDRTRTARSIVPWLGWQALTAVGVLTLLTVIHQFSPRFFYQGDKQTQYLPVAADIGRRLRAGEFLPVIDPALGQAGNYALDLQYGLFEPTHWLAAVGLSYVDNVLLATLLWAAAYLLVLACGVCALALRLGVPGPWAAAAGVAAAFSGFVLFWLSPSWVPGLSVAWVPWWWWAVAAPRVRPSNLVGVAAFTFLVCAGGWPATWLTWLAVVVGVAAETLSAPHRRALLRPRLLQLLATTGGGLAAVITVVPLLRAVEFTNRQTELANNGSLVPNLADVLAFASPGLHGDIDGFSAYSLSIPVFFGVWFALAVPWLVRWDRTLVRRPGMVAAMVALGLTVFLTQASSELGPLRWPVRSMSGVHLFLAVLTALLVGAGALVLTRARVAGVLGSGVAVGVLTFFRRPDTAEWITSSALLLAAVAALLLALRFGGARAAAVAALLGTLVLTGWTVDEHERGGQTDRGYPAVPRKSLSHPVPTLTLYAKQGQRPRWFAQGVAVGLARLTADDRVQPGYSSVSQIGWRRQFCSRSAHGYTCPDASARLFEVEPTTGQAWIDLLGYEQVVVHDGQHLERWRAAVDESQWEQTGRSEDFVTFSRREPLERPGRLAAVVDGSAEVTAVDVGRRVQTYEVRSDPGATLVFSDLFWPGYVATVDGEAVPVGAVSDTLLSVRVPAGTDGTLRVAYDILPTPVWTGLVGSGAALVLAAAVLSTRPAVRRRHQGTGRAGRVTPRSTLASSAAPDRDGAGRTPPGASPRS